MRVLRAVLIGVDAIKLGLACVVIVPLLVLLVLPLFAVERYLVWRRLRHG